MRAIAVSAALGLLAYSLSAIQVSAEIKVMSSAPLDETVWWITMTPDDQAQKDDRQPFDETLLFGRGTVSMVDGVKHGFMTSSYSTTESFGEWSFRTKQTSVTDGKTVWTGEVSGDSIKGTMTWTKEDGTTWHYTFKGKRAYKPDSS